MPDPINPIAPHGKTELNKALPKLKGGHVLTLREVHDYRDHLSYIGSHIQEFHTEHNVGSIGIEAPPYLMAYLWAYRDAQPGHDKEMAKTAIEQAYISLYGSVDESKRTADMHIKAIDEDIDIICFDARHPLIEKRNQLASIKEGASYSSIYDSNTQNNSPAVGILQQLTSPKGGLARNLTAQLASIDALLKLHPEYKARLDAIDAFISTMHKQEEMPLDAISVKIFDALADKQKNAITISGVDHLSEGSPVNYANGIFDESMDANGWTVTDAFIGSKEQLPKAINKYDNYSNFHSGRKQETNFSQKPPLYDHIDFVWDFDNDIVARPPSHPDPAVIKPLLGLGYDVFSNENGVPADSVYTPEQFNPSLIPELNSTIQQFQAALHIPRNINVSEEVKTSKSKAEIKQR